MLTITAISWPFLAKKINSSKSKLFEQKVKETIENARYEAVIKGKSFLLQVDDENISVVEINKIDKKEIKKERILITADGKFFRFK